MKPGSRALPSPLLAALVTFACAAPHVRAPLEEEPFVLSPGPSPSEREALLREHDASGRTTLTWTGSNHRVPLAHATVAGRPTLMLVDTGAYDHLLEGWFAHELSDGEASRRPAAVIDHANRKVGMDAWSSVSFAIDGFGPLPNVHPLVTRDILPGPRALGIGGILSPQKLVTGAGEALVLDFPAGEMTLEDAASAEARLASHATSLGTALRCGSGYTLPATIERQDARLLVDTGAFATDLKRSSLPGRALLGRSSVAHDIYAVGGPVGTRVLDGAKVTLGRRSTTLDVAIVADEPLATRCSSDGVVGMDVLASCVVVILPRELRIACD